MPVRSLDDRLRRAAAVSLSMLWMLAAASGPRDASAGEADPPPTVIVAVGASGSDEFGSQFRTWADRWREAARQGRARFHAVGLDDSGQASDREQLQALLTREAADGSEPLWLILIGHGTFDGKLARFNLRGPAVSAPELAGWLKPVLRPLAIINCTSSSGPFLNELSSANRIVITATRSGHEYNFARFGDQLSAAIADPQADLDKDDQTSLLEAFLLASARVREFYESDGRLLTEHALLDDNGDRLGTPADWFQGLRAVKSAQDGGAVDGLLAGQRHLIRSQREARLPAVVRERRDEIERELAELRRRKSELPQDEYLTLVEPLLVELSKLYQSAEREAEPDGVVKPR